MKLVAVFRQSLVYDRLLVRAFQERCSVSEVVRRALTAYQDFKRKDR